MNSFTSTSQSLRRLTIAASGWTLLLVLVSALGRISEVEPSAWIELSYWITAGLGVLLTLAVAASAWRNYRADKVVLVPAGGAVLLALAQLLVGAMAAWVGHHPLAVIAHLLVAAACLASLLFVAIAAHLPRNLLRQAGISGPNQRVYFRFLLFTGAVILLVLISGTSVTGAKAGLACPDWPLCEGEIFPPNPAFDMVLNLLHRFTVVAAGVGVAGIILQSRRCFPEHALLVKWSTALGFLFLAQAGLGGLNVLLRFPGFMSAAHLALAISIWGSLVILASIFYLTAKSTLPEENKPPEVTSGPLATRQKAAIYFKLTKPWILVLLLITTVGAMFIAAEGLPPISLILYTLLGGTLAASGASVLNSYVDSDIDGLMSRTSRRPTVTGLVTPQETLFFGLALSTLSFLVFAVFVNILSAALSTLGIIYYVFFYTLYLKRATIHNIIIGGAAGAIPPLVGWTAVTNSLDLGAFYLFAIIFFWTPPHTWALALLVKKDYARARVPMLPVVAGDQETTYQIFLYSVLLITLTLLPFVAQLMGWLYVMAAVVLGVPFLYLAWTLWRNYTKSNSKRLYKFSQLYLALLFLMMALDRTLL
ncbi:MAG TPA: heme o synthase [Anaerolineae bacterium]|nr:heme o synthase [Anaerolineae bacterium]